MDCKRHQRLTPIPRPLSGGRQWEPIPAPQQANIMKTPQDKLQPWREKLEAVRKMGAPKLIPSSRRYIRDCRHPYGWQISYRQTVQWPDGNRTRVYFSDIGVDRCAAIGNSLRAFSAADMSPHHPVVRALYETIKA